jgi:hypothetical protein
MKKKNLLFTAIAIFGLATITSAQVPNYVPTTGLVGWWPFNGNANDESGNGNNGTVNGATLTSDRNGLLNSSYNFNVTNWSFGSGGDNIYIPYNPSFNFSDFTISTWVKRTSAGSAISPQSLSIIRRFQYGYNNPNGETWVLEIAHETNPTGALLYGTVIEQSPSPAASFYSQSNQIVPLNQWCNIIMTYSQDTISLYINNQLVGIAIDPSITINTVGNSGISIGLSEQANGQWAPFDGSIDDIGIWNRALDSCEVKDLYFSSLGNCCNISLATQPINQSVNISNNAQFTTSTSDSLATFQWQTDLGIGFQNLNSVGQYIGTTNDTLTIVNTTLSNNNQPFRCIVSSGSCTDTSSIAVLAVVNSTGINEVSQSNLFSVYPNPASDEINLKSDVKLLGSVYTIFDNTGKFVLSGKINSENTIIEIGNLSGGFYLFSIGENLKQTFKVIKQ